MNIIYRLTDYLSKEDLKSINVLYKRAFNIDAGENLKILFSKNPAGEPLSVIAFDGKKIIGHFGTAKLNASVNGEILSGRISMGFMVDSDYRGQGIAGNLSEKLFEELRKRREDDFVIGFANDVSYKMHVERMGYELIRNYNFIELPKSGPAKHRYDAVDEFKSAQKKIAKNAICHDAGWLNWRYGNSVYKKYISDGGNYFVVTKFQDKIDILYWSEMAGEDELLDFANYVYETEKIALISTWNTFDYLDGLKKQDRNYHFTMNILTKEKEKSLKDDWIFYMGDCELF